MDQHRDEELLGKGLELNDTLQSLLAKHDAIASGTPLPSHIANSSPQKSEVSASDAKSSEAKESSPSTPTASVVRFHIDEEEEEEDEFAQLARRYFFNYYHSLNLCCLRDSMLP